MSERARLEQALLNADAAGDVAAAQVLAQELRRISAQAETAEKARPSFGAVAAEAARRGVTNLAGYLGGIGLMQQEAKRTGRTTFGTFAEGQRAVADPLMARLGSTGVQPADGPQRIFSAGVEAAVDPTSYLFPAITAVRRMGPVAQAVMRPTEQAIIGSAAQGGQIAGSFGGGSVGEIFGARPTGELVGGLLGGVLGGTTSAWGLSSNITQGQRAFQLGKGAVTRAFSPTDQDALLRNASTKVQEVFEAAIKADPNFADTLEKAQRAQRAASIRAPNAPTVDLPLNALLADNPVINAFIKDLASKDPVFKASYGAQFQNAVDALRANQFTLFGNPAAARLTDTTPQQMGQQARSTAGAQARRQRTIDEEIADLSNTPTVDPTAFGQRIGALLNRKEEAARNSVNPLYAQAFDIAKAKNVELPPQAVGDIFEFVAGERASDIFKNFPSIYGAVFSRFRPQTTQASPILDASGNVISTGGIKFSSATVEDLDSLKREINKQLRKSSDEDNIRMLVELKNRVNSNIDNLDSDFVAAYRRADSEYLNRVGLPFSAETLRSIDRKRFVEQISPALIGNKSNVAEFIRATGDDGVQVARDAFYDNFTRSVVKDGEINPKLAERWIAANQGGMSLIPGLSDEIRSTVGNVQALFARKRQINDGFRNAAGERLVSESGFRSPAELTGRMYSDPNFTKQFMKRYSPQSDDVKAVRSFMLDDILQSNDPVAFLSDRSKGQILNEVFGKVYIQKVKEFALASSRLKSDPSNVPSIAGIVPETVVERVTGTKPESIVSRFTNQVQSAQFAVASLISRYFARETSEKTSEELKRIFLDNKDAIKLLSAASSRANERQAADNIVDVAKKYGIDFINMARQDLQSGAARGAVLPSQEPLMAEEE
jgi:hypothetical protein